MKFIDTASIIVIAGHGGNGCFSFRKIGKNRTMKKPDGSNGGDGGDVWILADSSMNTLNDFFHCRVFKAGHGSHGNSRNCTGKKGKDIFIKVPQGTRVYCQKTSRFLGDMIDHQHDRLMVAKGGHHGIGNRNFRYMQYHKSKSFIYNSNSRRYGMPGELQYLLLELLLIADVGVFGLPNSGKSSFISIISKANPKIADYPFTTLSPQLGMVKMNNYNDGFIIADIPGIVKGASAGVGLGIQFLKHLKRCKILLHFVDIAPLDNSDPLENIINIEQELRKYDVELIKKIQWLVFNKIDLLNKHDLLKVMNRIFHTLNWNKPCYFVSVKNEVNITSLCNNLMKVIIK